MFEILEKSGGNIVGIKVSGKLVHEDYEEVVPKLEKIIDEYGSIRCYCDMNEFESITPHAFWDELKFDTKHFKHIERCAVVGDPSWNQWMTKLGNTLFAVGTMKYFEPSQCEEAWQWVCEGTECSCSTEPQSTATCE